jgi:hypothetical protein
MLERILIEYSFEPEDVEGIVVYLRQRGFEVTEYGKKGNYQILRDMGTSTFGKERYKAAMPVGNITQNPNRIKITCGEEGIISAIEEYRKKLLERKNIPITK